MKLRDFEASHFNNHKRETFRVTARTLDDAWKVALAEATRRTGKEPRVFSVQEVRA